MGNPAVVAPQHPPRLPPPLARPSCCLLYPLFGPVPCPLLVLLCPARCLPPLPTRLVIVLLPHPVGCAPDPVTLAVVPVLYHWMCARSLHIGRVPSRVTLAVPPVPPRWPCCHTVLPFLSHYQCLRCASRSPCCLPGPLAVLLGPSYCLQPWFNHVDSVDVPPDCPRP